MFHYNQTSIDRYKIRFKFTILKIKCKILLKYECLKKKIVSAYNSNKKGIVTPQNNSIEIGSYAIHKLNTYSSGYQKQSLRYYYKIQTITHTQTESQIHMIAFVGVQFDRIIWLWNCHFNTHTGRPMVHIYIHIYMYRAYRDRHASQTLYRWVRMRDQNS